MSTSALATDRWTKILCQKRDLFERIGSNALSLVNSRALFRDYFEAECKRLKEKSTQRLLGKLDNSFDHIDSFIRILECATLDKGEKGYIGLIWGACFAVIHCVSIRGSSQSSLRGGLDGPDGPVQLVADLNNSLPNFKGYLQYGTQPSVQEALQDIFVSHIDCCLLMVSLLTGRTLLSSITKNSDATCPRECIRDAAETIAMAKARLDDASNLLSVNGVSSEVLTNNISSRRSIPGSWPSNTPWQPIPDTFQINKILGVGASGHVEKVTDTSKGTVYARKHMAKPKGHNWDKFRSRVLDEFYSMRRVACRHVINVDFYQEDAERAMEIYMTPVADGNLMDLLEICVDDSYPALQIQIIYSWFGCLLKALNFVHSKKVVHKDIKPPNILVKDNIIYLADFGLSRDFEGGASQSIGPFAGTFEYQAPEFVTNQPHGRATDVFSLGCVFSEMLTVVHRKDLDQFRELRRTPVPPALIEMHHIVYSFHKNLNQVKEWVGDLRGTDKDNILVDTIFGMLEVDTLTRTSTVQALKRLESRKELCCTCGL